MAEIQCNIGDGVDVNIRSIFYLILSFFSYIGDIILLYSLPTGFGIHKNNLSFTVLLFLIPALAIFLSTFLNGKLSKRIDRSNIDYGFILFFIAIVEVIIALTCLNINSDAYLVPLILIFVFIYAFTKEGIPRLFYVVAIYRYFCSDEEYKKIAGIDYALKILASFFGIFISSLLIKNQLWLYSLLIDSLSFLPLAFFLIFYARKNLSTANSKPKKTAHVKESFILKKIYRIVPLLSLGSCLFWPHLALLSGKLNVIVPWKATLLMGVMALPGLICGLLLSKITTYINSYKVIYILPLIYILSGLLFLAYPDITTLSLVMIFNGFITGVYWPLDYSFRNKMDSLELVKFNTNVTRGFSIAQAISCSFVVLLSSHSNFINMLIAALATLSVFYVIMIFTRIIKNENNFY